MEHFKWSVEVYFSCFESKYIVSMVCTVHPGPAIPTNTSENTFRKNEINVGMASRSIGRKEVGFNQKLRK